MRKKATPGEGREARAEQFAYTPTQPGTSKVWYGWCAGEPYWCKVHEHTRTTPGTKVCVNWYTDGALPCPRCRPAAVPTTICYVPIYREIDGKPCLVIVHESAADLLAGVEYPTYVMIGCVEKGSSVFVRPASDQPKLVTDNPLRKRACDIGLSLFTIWGYAHLAQWESARIICRPATSAAPDDGTATAGEVATSPAAGGEVEKIGPGVECARRSATGEAPARSNLPATAGDALDATMNRIRGKVSRNGTNGKH